MRVLHVTDDMAGLSGIRSYLDTLEAGTSGTDLEIQVFAPPGDLHSRGSLVSRWYSPHWASRVTALIRRFRPDVVHAHSVSLRLSPAPLRSAIRAGVPVVMTVHDYGFVCPRRWMIDPDDEACNRGFGAVCLVGSCRATREGWAWLPYQWLRWLKLALHRTLLRRWVELFICPSAHLGEWMRRSLGLDGTRVVSLPNFAPPVGEAPPPPPATPRALFAGRLSREKGVDVLLRATPRVAALHPGFEVIVAGDGPERSALEDLARGLGMAARVRFVGRLGADALGEAYRQASLCVLPTLWMENCPVAVLEAFAHGRAVVATRIGGLPELVQEGRTGSLFARGDETALGGVMGELLARPELLARLGANAFAAARGPYSRASHLRRIVELYERVCDPGHRGRGQQCSVDC